MATTAQPPVRFHDFTVPTHDGNHLAATFVEKTDQPANQVVVVCHGLLNTRYSRTVRTLANGIPHNVCLFEFRGNGASTGTTRYTNYDEEAEDLRYVVQYLRNARHCQVRALMGHSKGAAAVFLYTVKYNDVPLVVDVAGRFDMTASPMLRFTKEQQRELDTKGECVWTLFGYGQDVPYIVTAADLAQRAHIDMSVVQQIDFTRVQVLIAHGEEDEVVPVSEGRRFYEMMRRSPTYDPGSDCLTLAPLPHTGHVFSEPHEQQALLAAVNAWLAKRWAQIEGPSLKEQA
ncbi:hypothetical protein H4R34_001464 [Dimargaris verticillata]|uniref:Serine aminopeptidase S33 domain-containing protein n=1 Tax=Dimargaris verticillata TaxID=2761393 RepID=A0A9W8B4M3_9FUNG|nr:hypothetical protein H4R34_001464 [Dimargaris verticillata]